MTRRQIDGLLGWFREDGKIYERVSEKIEVGYWSTDNVADLGKRLTEFADTHKDAAVAIEHSEFAQGDYSCETHLELTGHAERTEDELKAERKRLKDRARSLELARQVELRNQLAKIKKELGE